MWLPDFSPVVNNLVMDADNIEVLKVSCFGWRAKNKNDSWWYLVNNSGWDKRTKDDVVAKIEVSLAADVNECQGNLFRAEFHDVASDMAYLVKFENANKLWSLTVKDSPAAPIDKKVKQEFFKSECFKKTCLRAIEILTRSKAALDGYVSQLMKEGKLLKVDELKYNRIMKYISDQELMKNLRLHKFMQ